MFNLFVIVEAYYLYFMSHHGGQWSNEYKGLSRMLRYFKPSPGLSPSHCDSEVREAYEALCTKKGVEP